jgi:alpha-L-rhamnosidase
MNQEAACPAGGDSLNNFNMDQEKSSNQKGRHFTSEEGNLSRREFFRNSVFGGTLLMVSPYSAVRQGDPEHNPVQPAPANLAFKPYSPLLDLSPARWIWYPSERTLQNSVFLFRKTMTLDRIPATAKGWILADSRYRLYVNGTYVQFGPAPFDPRRPEADPADITHLLRTGENVIGIEVLYYGIGEGTWPTGKPGLIMNLQLAGSPGPGRLVTDETWMVSVAESWKPGQYKRWYLRAFQEEFDARLYPYGWNRQNFKAPAGKWLPAMIIDLPANKPPISSPYDEYQQEIRADARDCDIRQRSIPLMKEFHGGNAKLADRFAVEWKGDPERYFEFLTPGLYEAKPFNDLKISDAGHISFSLSRPTGVLLTFELKEQMVGFPVFTIDAPEGTKVELMVQEGHSTGRFTVMNNRLHSWTRFICREGRNEFRTFDYESLRWIQLHIHGKNGVISVSNVGVIRRMSGWKNMPDVRCSDDRVNRVISATVNTLVNSAQDLMVDCMGRERQQYSGDVGHQVHPLFFAFGDFNLPKRYINTFSQGITLDGFFMDSWPAYDRLARIAQRQMNLTMWGPIIDHGVGFVFDCYYYWLYSGNLDAMHEVYPRLLRFFNYLDSLTGEDGLLPVENLGLTWVWIDSDCFTSQRHKKCSFNLYSAAMMMNALAPIAQAFGENENAARIRKTGEALLEKTIDRFWDSSRQVFVDNLPWAGQEGGIRLSDRTLSMAVIYDMCPGGNSSATVKALEVPPQYMGLSFPANAIWRLWALGNAGMAEAIVKEIKGRWYGMDSVQLNNTLQEHWNVSPDSRGQWSHCAVGPLFAVYSGLAGITPLEPGSKKVRIKPNPGPLQSLALGYHTPGGQLFFSSKGTAGNRNIDIGMPPGCEAVLLTDKRENLSLERIAAYDESNLSAYRLEPGKKYTFKLQYT